MTLRQWLIRKIDSINKRGYEPLDTYGNEYRAGYLKACCDIRALLAEDPCPAASNPAPASTDSTTGAG